jgi:hypothetical protein
MKLISLGGINACPLAHTLRTLNQPAYPYDWIVSKQSFIIDSFNSFNNFFDFDEKYVYSQEFSSYLYCINKNALMLHDFRNFIAEKDFVIQKYKRRFERLNNALDENEDILFIRLVDDLKDVSNSVTWFYGMVPREEEDFQQWEFFINNIQSKYNKKIKLLLITTRQDIYNTENLMMYSLKEFNLMKSADNIILAINSAIKTFS